MKRIKDLESDPIFKQVCLPPRFFVKKGWAGREDGIGEIFVYHISKEFCKEHTFYDEKKFAEPIPLDMGNTVKLLYIGLGRKLSTHFHCVKHEYFYLLSGEMEVELTADGRTEKLCMEKDECIYIAPGMVHSMRGLQENTVLLEVSTTDYPEDSYRIRKGD